MATRVLPASPNFGQAKHGQKGPSATFPPKGVCSPTYTGLFTFYGLSQYLSAFLTKKISLFSLLDELEAKQVTPDQKIGV